MLTVLCSLALLDGSFSKVWDLWTRVNRFLIFKKQTTKEPTITVEGLSKLQTLKWKIGYEEFNDEAEKRLAGKRSVRSMEITKEVELVEKNCVQNMEVDM